MSSSSTLPSPYRLASVALAATPEKPDVGAEARLAQKAAILAAVTDQEVREVFQQNGGFCCDKFRDEFPDGVRELTKCAHCGRDNELAVCPEPGCDVVRTRMHFNCWGGTCQGCDRMGQGICVLCLASAPCWKLDGRKCGRKKVKAPLCKTCFDAHPHLIPFTCGLTLAEEEALKKREKRPWEKRRRLTAAAVYNSIADELNA